MSSSKPCKSRSGSVHDPDSESSIEYVQTQSPMSYNIPPTTPIASSINLSGLNIDVENLAAPSSSTWSIPNISVTPIPPNPTNTQVNVCEGPGITPEISSKANPQSKFPPDFLLNLVRIQSRPRNPLGKIWNLKASQSNHRSQSNIVITGHHHLYASTPRTAHASSSREKIVDDEDETMSPNHSETNDEPRRDNFMELEEGTKSNCEFTHPQMPLSQGMLEQSKIRKQRNQAHKDHNVRLSL
ncbi:hypothetical protein O181_016571 [Austropuccinia psidii MF-1]|uniref:Uncharacterized protein n=1 Tax=Austropuccinia psidii MF-1 TaxID=1389203 RepID=A0A9Q3C5X7_9BASI|nr:hypothetical protein [Austropuccinia psidii MF-1]